jgi:tetratricopeptide (TPR) repeat protein
LSICHAQASLHRYEEALEDAQKVVELKPEWPKGYSRVGAAALGAQQYDEAIAAYEKGARLGYSSCRLCCMHALAPRLSCCPISGNSACMHTRCRARSS